MAIYHFAWDLEFFGYLAPTTTAYGGWKLFARCIASSFLFLVGVSLWLAHKDGVRWPGFWNRWLMVAAGAAAITAATYFATPQGFVFFGILHQIALASLLGLLFLRLTAWVLIPVASAVIALPWLYASDLFNTPAFWWVGLSSIRPRSSDYVPLFPWFGAVLLGIATAKLAAPAGLFERLRRISMPRWTWLLDFFGRHSLAFYLIHQPVLISIVWVMSQIAPPPPVTEEARFIPACQNVCVAERSTAFCQSYCGCMLDELQRNNALDTVVGTDHTDAQKQTLQDTIMLCTFQTEDALQEEGAP